MHFLAIKFYRPNSTTLQLSCRLSCFSPPPQLEHSLNWPDWRTRDQSSWILSLQCHGWGNTENSLYSHNCNLYAILKLLLILFKITTTPIIFIHRLIDTFLSVSLFLALTAFYQLQRDLREESLESLWLLLKLVKARDAIRRSRGCGDSTVGQLIGGGRCDKISIQLSDKLFRDEIPCDDTGSDRRANWPNELINF